MVNHFSAKGYLSELEDYISELKGKRKIRLGNRDKQLLNELIYKPEYLSSLNKYGKELYDDEDALRIKKSIDAKHAPHYLLTGPVKKPATLKAIKKLLEYKLIKQMDKKRLRIDDLFEDVGNGELTGKEVFAAMVKRAKLFDITEYGLFCFLSQVFDFIPSMLGLRWESKTMKLLLSPYFERETVAGRLTTLQFWMIRDFLQEALHIVEQGLSKIENPTELSVYMFEEENKTRKIKKYRTWEEEQMAKLEDELQWHAKSFALRLIVDTASKDKEKSEESRNKLSFLFHDKKFLKLAEDTMHEILSYYRGGKLLEYDRNLHP